MGNLGFATHAPTPQPLPSGTWLLPGKQSHEPSCFVSRRLSNDRGLIRSTDPLRSPKGPMRMQRWMDSDNRRGLRLPTSSGSSRNVKVRTSVGLRPRARFQFRVRTEGEGRKVTAGGRATNRFPGEKSRYLFGLPSALRVPSGDVRWLSSAASRTLAQSSTVRLGEHERFRKNFCPPPPHLALRISRIRASNHGSGADPG